MNPSGQKTQGQQGRKGSTAGLYLGRHAASYNWNIYLGTEIGGVTEVIWNAIAFGRA